MKIWNTKYCLTDGITEHDVEETDSNIVTIMKAKTRYSTHLHGEGKEWHKSLEGAASRANEIKIKKLQSLAKSMKRISAIKFDC
ncbi:MAG: hypothetical protein V3V84_07815 [Candidatus Bathyarchaeia archaeon]